MVRRKTRSKMLRYTKKVSQTENEQQKILILKSQLSFNVGDWDKSIQYYQRSIEIGTEVGKEDNVASAYFEIGKIFEERNIIDDALKNFEKGWEISKRIKNKKLSRDSKRGIVRLRMKMRNGLLT